MTFEEYSKSLGFDLTKSGRVYFDTYEMADDYVDQCLNNGIKAEAHRDNVAGYDPYDVLDRYRYYVCEVRKEQDA